MILPFVTEAIWASLGFIVIRRTSLPAMLAASPRILARNLPISRHHETEYYIYNKCIKRDNAGIVLCSPQPTFSSNWT
ncbi:hypothetical protein DE146DRAFT_649786, partial [Phaeosphaeria sp. MPI-PUGE-AT-0046c]